MGKVSDKDFADIGATYRARAMRVMRQLDDAGRDYETMIAQGASAERLAATPAVASGDAAGASRSDAGRAARKCGTRNDADAEFCKKCGNKLVRDAS